MNTKYYLILFFSALLWAASCSNEQRYRTPTGLQYKLYSKGKDSVIRMGHTVKYQVIQRAGDSIFDNSYEEMPRYWMCMPGFENRYNPLEVFDYGIRNGDSIVVIQIVDSMVAKRILDSIPAWMKPGDKWTTHIQVVEVFTGDSLLHADKQREAERVMKLQRRLGAQRIMEHLSQNGLSATASGDSLFTLIHRAGSGDSAVQGDQVQVHFNVTSLKGNVLNDTRDSLSQGPASFQLGQGYFPEMIETQLRGLKVGDKLTCYIPGVLLFGPEPQQRNVRVNDDWAISIEVLAVQKGE